jgi:tetratricopeptide (TPR) repeat protein
MKPHRFWTSRRLIWGFLAVQLISKTVGAQDVGPITKDGLISSFKNQSLKAKDYVELIKRDGVNFRLETCGEKQCSTEKQIRNAAGTYLGPKSQDDLIAAIRRGPYRIVLLLTDINPVRAEAASVEGRNYGLTETIYGTLKNAFSDSSDMVFQHVSKAFGDAKAATDEGQLYKANYVVWGHFIPKKNVRFYVFITSVQGTQELPALKEPGIFEYPASEVNERFTPNDEIANDVTYTMLVVSGVARLECGELDLALDRLEKATTLPVRPHMISTQVVSEYLFRGYFRRGLGRGGQNKWDSAISDLTKAIKIKPDSGEAYWQRGVFHYTNATKTNYSKAEDQSAVEDFETATKLLPSVAELFLGLGQAYLRMSNGYRKDNPAEFQSERNKAKAAFRKALELAKTNKPGLIAQVENKLKEIEK